jgi:hypothetical protein
MSYRTPAVGRFAGKFNTFNRSVKLYTAKRMENYDREIGFEYP